MRVLIVDGHPDTAETTAKLLKAAGHQCRSATCGLEALAVADAFKPELAMLDIELPDTDGCTLQAVLRYRLAKRPPYFVAMSCRTGTLKVAFGAGFDACPLKPIGLDQLLRAVRLAQFEIHGSPIGRIVLQRLTERA